MRENQKTETYHVCGGLNVHIRTTFMCFFGADVVNVWNDL